MIICSTNPLIAIFIEFSLFTTYYWRTYWNPFITTFINYPPPPMGQNERLFLLPYVILLNSS
nr:MAG TPA: hypothetical protein [Caudoviricetes sp.]